MQPLEAISAATAYANTKGNAQNGWPKRGAADDRLSPLAEPGFRPSFTLEPGERVFTIGSCFARNVEGQLARLGYDVPMIKVRINDEPGDSGVFNNYALPSILNELEWALETPFDPKTGFVEVSRGGYCDLHLPKPLRPAPIERLLKIRERITAGVATVKDCRVVIITLGLVEAWFDAKAGRYLNIAPPKQIARAQPDRFSLHVLSIEQIRDYMERVVALLSRKSRADQRIVLTVSPVPLAATFTTQDVMVANAYSKAALRVVAQEFWQRYDHIDYFPSYESVILSERSRAWQDDNRHVRAELVELNVGRMISAYSGAGSLADAMSAEKMGELDRAEDLYLVNMDTPQGRLGLARVLSRKGDTQAAIDVLAPLDSNEATVTRASILRRGRSEAVRGLYGDLEAIGSDLSLRELLRAAFQFGDFEHAERAARLIEAKFPRSYFPPLFRGKMALAREDREAAFEALSAAAAFTQNSREVFYLLAQAARATGREVEAVDAEARMSALS